MQRRDPRDLLTQRSSAPSETGVLRKPAHRAHILIVQYETDIRRLVSHLLKGDGYSIETSGDGLEAQKLAMTQPFDLIILDVMLPSKNGCDVCRHLRKNGINTPILMLTRLTELNDKVQALKAGSDDYLTKPFEAPELRVRVEALLRRASPAARPDLKTYDFDGIHVDFTQGRVTKNEKAKDLGERQCRLLRYLVERKGVILHATNSCKRCGGKNRFGTHEPSMSTSGGCGRKSKAIRKSLSTSSQFMDKATGSPDRTSVD
jgi:DNA-binding response OmpR family regulator